MSELNVYPAIFRHKKAPHDSSRAGLSRATTEVIMLNKTEISNRNEESLDKHIRNERAAVDVVVSFARENRELLKYIAHWGDGRGGHISSLIIGELGIHTEHAIKAKKSKRPEVSKRKRDMIFDAFGNQCLSCKSYDDICIDHVIPLSKGGANTVDNMQPLCRICNSAKGVGSTDYRRGISL